MPAEPIARAKEVRDDGSIVEIVIWRVDHPLLPCTHPFKDRLYFGQKGRCRVRYDNERGKGDHRHIEGLEQRHEFVSLAKLLDDFQHHVETWREP